MPCRNRDRRVDADEDALPSHLRRMPTVVLFTDADTLLEVRGSDANPHQPSIQMSWAGARSIVPASYVALALHPSCGLNIERVQKCDRACLDWPCHSSVQRSFSRTVRNAVAARTSSRVRITVSIAILPRRSPGSME
jgi:hypothetical protein